MTKVRKKIGTIPINDIEQQVQQSTSAAITQMQQDVSDFIDEETAQYPEIGGTFKYIEDPEGRSEITTDSEGKILSYRDADGVMHENVGISAKTINLPEDALEQSYQYDKNHIIEKKWYLPKFGTVRIKSETFYLSTNSGVSSASDIYVIQDLEDNDENAYAMLTIAFYYVKNSLVNNGDGTYSKHNDGIEGHDVKLDFYAAGKVAKIDNKYYVISSLTDGQVTPESIEVTQIEDVPNIKTWPVDKKTEHYCIADIDFGTFYNNTNVIVGMKYQGSGSLQLRKRGLRLTYYKSNAKPYYPVDDDKFGKKDKVKIGGMVRLSGYNMKSYFTSDARVIDPVLANLFIEVWESRGKEAFPWNKDSVVFNGATGFIKSFPIETWIGDESYGLQFFSLKKDERNYMLDGTDASGIFAQGVGYQTWATTTAANCTDEMMDEMSQETADALNVMFDAIKTFINGDIDSKELEIHIDAASWIDYYIGLNIFSLYDDVFHNMVFHSRADKMKFYAFFYDLDNALIQDYNVHFLEYCENRGVNSTDFWRAFTDVYKDSIINRYAELRKSVLSIRNIQGIYEAYIAGIPEETINREVSRWGNGNPEHFDVLLSKLEKRMNWLDNNYFDL